MLFGIEIRRLIEKLPQAPEEVGAGPFTIVWTEISMTPRYIAFQSPGAVV